MFEADGTDVAGKSIDRPSRFLDYVFLLAAIAHFGKVWYWPTDSEIRIEVDKPLGEAIHLLALLAIPYVTWRFGQSFMRGMVEGSSAVLLPLAALIFLSAAWSIAPSQSLITAIDFLCILMIAVNTAQRLTEKELMTVVFLFVSIVIAVSALTSAMGLDFALMRGVHDGKWRGLFPHKNNMGEFIVMSIIPLIFNRRQIKVRPQVFWGSILICVICLVFASSSTAISMIFLSFFAAGLFAALRLATKNFIRIYFFTIVSALFLYILATTSFIQELSEILVTLVGRDLTFTGRDRIWQFYFDRLWDGPLLGKGYAVYYLDEEILGPARILLFPAIRSPHNAYLALAHGIGWVGVAIFFFWMFLALRACWQPPASSLKRATFALIFCFAVFGFVEVSGGALPSIGLVYVLLFSMAVKQASHSTQRCLKPAPFSDPRTAAR